MKILSVGGTRPQFVKMAVLVRAFEAYNRDHQAGIEHRLLHTGQHYDSLMSNIFFEELGMPTPQTSLGIPSGPPGRQTAAMLASIEASLINWTPDLVIIYGDTNSTLAAALAAAKLHVPMVHLEAGLRSFRREMQEEINRIVSDHVSDLLLCPTRTAVEQLHREGLGDRAVYVGDVMLDAAAQFSATGRSSRRLEELGLADREYALVTLHRAENTNDIRRLGGVVTALETFPIPVVLPMHPRLKHLLGEEGRRMLASYGHIHLIEPVGYVEMLQLQQRARLVLTDSGGVQKEAYFLGVPCLTLRDETEWTETLHGGWNALVGTDAAVILRAAEKVLAGSGTDREPRDLAAFGEGHAGASSVNEIVSFMGRGHAQSSYHGRSRFSGIAS